MFNVFVRCVLAALKQINAAYRHYFRKYSTKLISSYIEAKIPCANNKSSRIVNVGSKRKGRRGDRQDLLFLTKPNHRWPKCHRYMNKGDSYTDQRNHRTNSFWWVEVMTPLVREGGLVYWLVDTATVSDTNMASPWRQPSGLCQQQIGHHNHHALSASF